jgi:hypothetical protein
MKDESNKGLHPKYKLPTQQLNKIF